VSEAATPMSIAVPRLVFPLPSVVGLNRGLVRRSDKIRCGTTRTVRELSA
jgi:hypothetical protein